MDKRVRVRLAMMRRPATKLPRCGVQMKIARVTMGNGSTKSPRRNRSRAWSDSSISSSGLLLTAFQSRSPVLTTCILTRSPPWLWPIRTI